MLYRVLFAATFGCLLASMAVGQCWECDPSTDDATGELIYPGVECAPVSVSDEGKTECYVVVSPNGSHCVFENSDTDQPGQDCAWEPPQPPGGGHTTPPDQGCEWSSFEDEIKLYQITPNGEAVDNWKPTALTLASTVG